MNVTNPCFARDNVLIDSTAQNVPSEPVVTVTEPKVLSNSPQKPTV